jgi:hypothetical protein
VVEGIVASELLCIHDEVLVLGEQRPVTELRRVLARSPDDGPTELARVRSTELGLPAFSARAEAALTALSAPV